MSLNEKLSTTKFYISTFSTSWNEVWPHLRLYEEVIYFLRGTIWRGGHAINPNKNAFLVTVEAITRLENAIILGVDDGVTHP